MGRLAKQGRKLRARYRYSIIDCPALSARSDALSLAPHLDGIVMVVAANDTHKAQIANAERQIHMVNGKVLGFLLNNASIWFLIGFSNGSNDWGGEG